MSGIYVELGSRIGGRSENQDSCLAITTPLGELIIVCDGMGGGPGGKFASQSAICIIRDYILGQYKNDVENSEDVLKNAIALANSQLYEYSQEHTEFRGMGTTVVALLLNEVSGIVAHVGDSRLYQLRRGKKIFRTFDHSLVFERVKKDRHFSEEDARVAKGSNVITRALGIHEHVVVDTAKISYEKGDRFMLCTDGIWGAFPEKELLKYVAIPISVSGAVDGLVVRVDNKGFQDGGGHDNLTVAMLDVQYDSKYKKPMSRNIRHLLILLLSVLMLSLLLNAYFIIQNNTSDKSCIMEEDAALHKEKIISTDSQTTSIKADQNIIKRLDEIIAILEKLKQQNTSRARDNEIDRIAIDIKNMAEEISMHGISVEEWGQIEEEVGKKRMKQDNTKVKNNVVIGHYNSVIQKLKKIKEKIKNKCL